MKRMTVVLILGVSQPLTRRASRRGPISGGNRQRGRGRGNAKSLRGRRESAH